jgi:aminopeptidase YwaD
MLKEKNLIRTIDFLTSKETGGRVSGSEGARLTSAFLAKELADMGVQPAGDQDYFSYFDIYAARLKGEVILQIGERRLRHRIDFGEISRYASPRGNELSGELTVVRDEDEVDPTLLKGKVVLIPEKPKDFDLALTVKAAKGIGIAALLVESGSPRWFSKSLMGSRESSIPVFRVRKDVATELVNSQGQMVTISLPLISEDLPCQNVLGVIPGVDQTKTLVLSAHYDHIGDDPSGFRFPGAVDNASGVSIILEIARQLVNKNQPFNIFIAFFTGEESGLLGARHFVKHTNYPLSAVINVDSLGFEPKLNKMRNGHKGPGNWLADFSAEVIKERGIDFAWISGGEDSVAFQNEGITAIGLGQKPTDSIQRGIHTPDDTMENLYYEPVKEAYNIIEDIVQHILEHPNLL